MRISDWSSYVCSSDLIDDAQPVNLLVPRASQGRLPTGASQGAHASPMGPGETQPLSPTLIANEADMLSLTPDRKSVVEGKSVYARVDHGVRRNIIKKQITITQ